MIVSVSKLAVLPQPPFPGGHVLTFEAVYREHAAFVFRVLRRLESSEAEAEDAMQEVFVIVNQKLSTFEGRSKVTTWLYGICFRVASDRRRRAVRKHERLATDPGVFERVAPDDPLEELAAKQGATALENILDQMSLEQRAAFVLFELDGYECGDIAELVGCPIGTIHSRLHAARDVFKRESERFRRRQLGPSGFASVKERLA